ncbi:hypothetical protein DUI87_28508 [Hirundo rustica rustica]|uniref:Dynein heavy chain C-terminal domain-containing protein n=1 Tax=Hirundo rustica rustica TaxID=333673 RepID=A0A3M0JJU0_HIRRU|nr:hypothetical protein DUI87_28508 [Hirundo rustica rustica]
MICTEEGCGGTGSSWIQTLLPQRDSSSPTAVEKLFAPRSRDSLDKAHGAQAGTITDARLKELTPAMPVVFIRAVPDDKQDVRGLYPCPLYKTRQRGPTYVWTFNLKTKENPSKWVLAGVALLLQT